MLYRDSVTVACVNSMLPCGTHISTSDIYIEWSAWSYIYVIVSEKTAPMQFVQYGPKALQRS